MRALAITIVALSLAVPAYALTMQQTATEPAPAATTSAEPVDPNDPNQRVRCRLVEVTGSLVKRGRVCRTVAEWRRITENGNYNARKMVDESTSKQNGN